jgi:hypothetical protein
MAQAGCYIYRVDGVIMAREPWSVDRGLDGTIHVKTVRDATQFGVWLSLEADIFADGHGDYRFDLRNCAEGPIVKSARYHCEDGAVYFGPARQEIAPQGAHFFPLMRYFTGDMIAAILLKGGSHEVIVPDIGDMSALDTLFAPLHSVRTVVPVMGDPLAFDLSGGAYEAPARLHLNAEGLLAHYAFTDAAGKVWTCDLGDG